MKNILEIDNMITGTIAKSKSMKGGLHSWKTTREGTGEEDVYSRDQVDEILNFHRNALMEIRQELRDTTGI